MYGMDPGGSSLLVIANIMDRCRLFSGYFMQVQVPGHGLCGNMRQISTVQLSRICVKLMGMNIELQVQSKPYRICDFSNKFCNILCCNSLNVCYIAKSMMLTSFFLQLSCWRPFFISKWFNLLALERFDERETCGTQLCVPHSHWCSSHYIP